MKKLTLAIALLIIAFLAGCAIPLPTPITTNTSNVMEQKNETPAVSTNETAPQANETAPAETKAEEPAADLKDVPRKEVTEGDLVNFPNLKATDPDGDPITYTFTTPFDEHGKWQTKPGDAGEHLITITASDGTNTVSQQVLIIVNPANRAPSIEMESVIEINEGDEVELAPDVTDPDGDNVTVTYSGWMTSNTKATTTDDQGNHKVVIKASDGKLATTKEIMISVKNVNKAPELSKIPDKEIKEGEKVTIKPLANDPDGDKISFKYSDPIDSEGSWQTKVGDAGSYDITVTANDGKNDAETTFKLTVIALNKAPVIELSSPIQLAEGDTVSLAPKINDPEGDEVKVTYSGWMTSATKQTGYDDQGNHKVVITAKDTAGNEATLEVIVIVEDKNRPPVFASGSFN